MYSSEPGKESREPTPKIAGLCLLLALSSLRCDAPAFAQEHVIAQSEMASPDAVNLKGPIVSPDEGKPQTKKDKKRAKKETTEPASKVEKNVDNSKKVNADKKAAPKQAEPRKAESPRIDPAERARKALNKYYSGGVLLIDSAIEDLKSADSAKAQDSVAYIEALLRLAQDDEARGLRPQSVSEPFVGKPFTTLAIEARGMVHAAIFRVGPGSQSVKLLNSLSDDMLPSADGAAALIISEVSGPDALAAYTRILNRPASSALLPAAVLKKIGKNNLQEFAPKVKELAGHYRATVRQAARDAAAAMGISDLPPYNEADSVTPWLASQIAEISKLREEQLEVATLPEPLPVNDVAAAAYEFTKGDKTKGLTTLLQKINALPDDRLLFLQSRDDMFADNYKVAVRLFCQGKYKDAEQLTKFLTRPSFSASPLSGAATSLLAQFPDRQVDNQSFVLPSENQWRDLQKKMSVKEQVDYLAPRLRLLRGKEEKRAIAGNVSIVNLDAPQTNLQDGSPVVNPLVELRKIVTDVSNVPLLFPHLTDKHFILTGFDSGASLTRLESVADLARMLINESVQYPMLGPEFFSMGMQQQQQFLSKQEKLCKKCAGQTGANLSFIIADSTDDERAFVHHTFRLKEKKDARLRDLLIKRWKDFPSVGERNAETLYRMGGASAVKLAEEELKKSPAQVAHESGESLLQWSSAERQSATRFWLTLILLRENNPAALKEVARMLTLPNEQTSFVARQNYCLMVKMLLTAKTPEKMALAEQLVDKFQQPGAPPAEAAVESSKLLLIAGSKKSMERISGWLDREPSPAFLEDMARWIFDDQKRHYSTEQLRTMVPELKMLLQNEFDLVSAGKPSKLKTPS